MLTVNLTNPDAVEELRLEYLATLTFPLDGMWVAFTDLANHWEICFEDHRIGFACVNGEGRILQFHTLAPFAHLARKTFAELIRESKAVGAMVSTFEPWLPLCVDLQQQVKVHTLLYSGHQAREQAVLEGFEDLSFEVVSEAERPCVEEFTRSCFDNDLGEWLTGYLQNLVRREELLVLRNAGSILSTGELRVNDRQAPYADLGVIVSPRHRKLGVASNVLCRLKHRSSDAGLKPICSTTIDNIGAQRAISNAGFVDRHRILEISF